MPTKLMPLKIIENEPESDSSKDARLKFIAEDIQIAATAAVEIIRVLCDVNMRMNMLLPTFDLVLVSVRKYICKCRGFYDRDAFKAAFVEFLEKKFLTAEDAEDAEEI